MGNVSQTDFDHNEALELDRVAGNQVNNARLFKRELSYQEAVDRIVSTGISEVTAAVGVPLTFEGKVAEIRSIVEAGNEAVANDEGYVAVKKHVDAAYAILRKIKPEAITPEEKAAFDEIGEAHNDLAMDLAMMDEPEA